MLMSRIFATPGPLLLVALLGCNQTSTPSPAAAASAALAASKEAKLEDEIWKLHVEMRFLKLRVEALESGDATVSTEEQGYDVARTKFGPFTVSVRGATPYLDGHKVKLRVGNLTNASFDDARVKLSWGPPYEKGKGIEEWEKWEKSRKKREVRLTERLLPGSFTDVEVVLTPSRPEEIKSFSVGLELDSLQLRTR